MLHPSYTELMEKINGEEIDGEEPVINSRYSIVIATSRRARQLISGDQPLVKAAEGSKPLSIAVEELYDGKLHIETSNEDPVFENGITDMDSFEELVEVDPAFVTEESRRTSRHGEIWCLLFFRLQQQQGQEV